MKRRPTHPGRQASDRQLIVRQKAFGHSIPPDEAPRRFTGLRRWSFVEARFAFAGPKSLLRIALASLLLATSIAALAGLVPLVDTFSLWDELPARSQIAGVVWLVVLLGASGAYGWWAVRVLRGKDPPAFWESENALPFKHLSVNCLLAVFLAFGALYVLFRMHDLISLSTAGGVPTYLISKGWANSFTYFLYDTVRFCLFSFVAVWPVTVLKPQKPVLYSLAIMVVMVVLFQYWWHLVSWTSLPRRALWGSAVVLIHVLSIPAMYQLHLILKARQYQSPDA